MQRVQITEFYRSVKSAIDYRRGDNAIIHSLKVQRRVFHATRRFRIREIRREDQEGRRFAGHSYILSRLTSVRVPRVYLHFGARDATRPPVLSALPRIAVYAYRRRDVYRSCRIVLLVNFNEYHVNAKPRARRRANLRAAMPRSR